MRFRCYRTAIGTHRSKREMFVTNLPESQDQLYRVIPPDLEWKSFMLVLPRNAPGSKRCAVLARRIHAGAISRELRAPMDNQSLGQPRYALQNSGRQIGRNASRLRTYVFSADWT